MQSNGITFYIPELNLGNYAPAEGPIDHSEQPDGKKLVKKSNRAKRGKRLSCTVM